MVESAPTIGEYLKAVRLAKGWSLRMAAKAVGIAHSRVDECERGIDNRSGKPFQPSYRLTVKFAKAYDLLPADLLRRAGHRPDLELDEAERELLAAYRVLPDTAQRQMLNTLREIAANYGNQG